MKSKNKLIGEGLRLIWSSLDSHIDWTDCKSSEGAEHHIQAIKEYARTITILCELLEKKK